MSDSLITALVTIATGIIGLAALSAVLSKNANTAGVISAAAKGLAQDVGVAVSPITGGGFGMGSFGMSDPWGGLSSTF